MAVDAHSCPIEETEAIPIPAYAEAEEQFRILKQRLSIGWDKVPLGSLYQLQDAIVRSASCERLSHTQRVRLGTVYDAANMAISEILGTSSADDTLWTLLGISTPERRTDAEFEMLRANANTVIADLRACGRILLRKALRGIGIGR